MLIFQYYLCISYGMSNDYYRGKKDRIGGTWQGNYFVEDMCRDKSYLIIKIPEEKELGAIL